MAPPTAQAIQVAAGRLQRLQAALQRNTKARAAEAAALERRLGASLGFAAVVIMVLAGLMDILSFFDVQAVVSWLVTLIGALLAFRINRIRRAKHDITAAATVHARAYEVLRQRLRAAAVEARRPNLITPFSGVSYRFSSYLRQYVLWSLGTQLFELIPIVNWLPMFMAKHYRDIRNQRKELREAKEMMLPYRALVARIDALERFELEHASAQFAALAVVATGQRAERTIVRTVTARAQDVVSPGVRTVGRRTEPTPTSQPVPMRDVADILAAA